MKSRLATLFVLISFLSSCSYQEIMDEKMSVDSPDVISEFHASFSETEAGVDSLETRTYIEEDSQSSRLNLYWNEDDRISVFCGNTLNQQYRFDGETGDNSGTFKLIAADENVSYNPLNTPTNIAYYPYDENTEISEDGVLVVNFPETQYYAENSFGPGANAMVAVTENPDDLDLKFKNVGGYFKFKFYTRSYKNIKKITLISNDGEKIAGKAKVTCGFGMEPIVEMSEDAYDRITLYCQKVVPIGSTKSGAVEFWFTLPPVKFAKGFTIIVTNEYGSVFRISTDKTFEIKRNTIKPISTIWIDKYTEDEDGIFVDRAALVDLYNATDGDNWKNKTNWCSDRPLSEWYGVYTDKGGRIERIRLGNNNIVGDIPESIGNLSNLKELRLDRNQINSIPASIGNLSCLEEINFCDNNISTIPKNINNLTSLKNFLFRHNPLTEFPCLENLSNLETLVLDRCNLTGDIPESICSLTNLKSLQLTGNELSGYPKNIGNLSSLERLNLYKNHFTYIPDEIESLLNLKELALSENPLNCNIPDWIGSLKELKMLSIYNSGLDGTIPESIGNCTNLYTLDLHGNTINGPIPESIGNCVNLQDLRLDGNELSGPLPDVWGNLTNLTYLSLSNNNISGSIPGSISNLINLTHISLSWNNLSGNIPNSLLSSSVWKEHWPKIASGNIDLNLKNCPAPSFNLIGYDGSSLSSDVEYANNKLTLLYNWSNTCGDSKSFNVTLKNLLNKFRAKGFDVIGVVHGSQDVPWRNCNSLDNPIFGNYSVYPRYVAVDDKGLIVFESITSRNLTVSQDSFIEFVNEYFSYSDDNDLYTSTDYSQDGKVITLQEATVGKGVNLIFMGEAFVDKDMGSGGLYEQKMVEGMESFFSVEPYKSLRNRFNVYAVKVVSPNSGFDVDGAVHRINMDESVCFEYAQKIPGAGNNPLMVTVIYNAWYDIMRSRCRMYTDGSFVSYIMGPDVDGGVIAHESGGHGFAHLLDEYVEQGNEKKTLPEDYANYLDEVWIQYGYGANVDWRNDASTVKWAHFLNDSRYSAEELGVYEGAYLFGYGAYRPNSISIMRESSIQKGFNAPSREQIYKRVMQLSEGPDWVYDYEEFVAFDAPNRTAVSAPATKSASVESRNEHMRNHQPPTIIEGSWRDELKGR